MAAAGSSRATTTLLFYLYVDLPDVPSVVVEQTAWCNELSLRGRLRVAVEGINGILDGAAEALEAYTHRMDAFAITRHCPPIHWKWGVYPDACLARFAHLSVKATKEVT
jgi:predicted sulfurtransferase